MLEKQVSFQNKSYLAFSTPFSSSCSQLFNPRKQIQSTTKEPYFKIKKHNATLKARLLLLQSMKRIVKTSLVLNAFINPRDRNGSRFSFFSVIF